MRRFLYSKWFFLLLAIVCATDLAADLSEEIWGHTSLNSIAIGLDLVAVILSAWILPTCTSEGRSMATILVVEDEEAIRQLVSVVLEAAGHEVIAASNGVEGIALFRSSPDRFALILTDLKMPVMDG
jgi:hypothetical protein